MGNLNYVLYVPQTVKTILIVSRIIYKEATMGATKDNMNIKKNGVNVILDARKG